MIKERYISILKNCEPLAFVDQLKIIMQELNEIESQEKFIISVEDPPKREELILDWLPHSNVRFHPRSKINLGIFFPEELKSSAKESKSGNLIISEGEHNSEDFSNETQSKLAEIKHVEKEVNFEVQEGELIFVKNDATEKLKNIYLKDKPKEIEEIKSEKKKLLEVSREGIYLFDDDIRKEFNEGEDLEKLTKIQRNIGLFRSNPSIYFNAKDEQLCARILDKCIKKYIENERDKLKNIFLRCVKNSQTDNVGKKFENSELEIIVKKMTESEINDFLETLFDELLKKKKGGSFPILSILADGNSLKTFWRIVCRLDHNNLEKLEKLTKIEFNSKHYLSNLNKKDGIIGGSEKSILSSELIPRISIFGNVTIEYKNKSYFLCEFMVLNESKSIKVLEEIEGLFNDGRKDNTSLNSVINNTGELITFSSLFPKEVSEYGQTLFVLFKDSLGGLIQNENIANCVKKSTSGFIYLKKIGAELHVYYDVECYEHQLMEYKLYHLDSINLSVVCCARIYRNVPYYKSLHNLVKKKIPENIIDILSFKSESDSPKVNYWTKLSKDFINGEIANYSLSSDPFFTCSVSTNPRNITHQSLLERYCKERKNINLFLTDLKMFYKNKKNRSIKLVITDLVKKFARINFYFSQKNIPQIKSVMVYIDHQKVVDIIRRKPIVRVGNVYELNHLCEPILIAEINALESLSKNLIFHETIEHLDENEIFSIVLEYENRFPLGCAFEIASLLSLFGFCNFSSEYSSFYSEEFNNGVYNSHSVEENENGKLSFASDYDRKYFNKKNIL